MDSRFHLLRRWEPGGKVHLFPEQRPRRYSDLYCRRPFTFNQQFLIHSALLFSLDFRYFGLALSGAVDKSLDMPENFSPGTTDVFLRLSQPTQYNRLCLGSYCKLRPTVPGIYGVGMTLLKSASQPSALAAASMDIAKLAMFLVGVQSLKIVFKEVAVQCQPYQATYKDLQQTSGQIIV